jgi:hypothetical protein
MDLLGPKKDLSIADKAIDCMKSTKKILSLKCEGLSIQPGILAVGHGVNSLCAKRLRPRLL